MPARIRLAANSGGRVPTFQTESQENNTQGHKWEKLWFPAQSDCLGELYIYDVKPVLSFVSTKNTAEVLRCPTYLTVIYWILYLFAFYQNFTLMHFDE